MGNIELIRQNNLEQLGKYFLRKGVNFAIENSFGKSYEFLKEGLDLLTCDCTIGNWRDAYSKSSKNIFYDLHIKNVHHHEYYFTKAYIMSYETDKKELYLALDSIEKYLEITEDEYGYYVKGKILAGLEEYEEALKNLYFAREIRDSLRLQYKIGRLKEKQLNGSGIAEILKSFLSNPSSTCCVRILQKHSKQHCIELEYDEVNDNALINSFLREDNEYNFQLLYINTLSKYTSPVFPPVENAGISEFIDFISSNSKQFNGEKDSEEYYDDNYSYNDHHRRYDSDSWLSDAAGSYDEDVMNDAYWNLD